MKILHTADWHLGQKLRGFSRDAEHQRILKHLIHVIQEKNIELLIIAGDVFDVMSPPNSARQLYYRFLAELRDTSCEFVVIVGGNHDSPNMLNAAKDLLESLQVYVIGAISENIRNEIIELRNQDHELKAVVAAVPFLRDQDIRRSTQGETELERHQRVQLGIKQHYEALGNEMAQYASLDVPLIATGHLYVKDSDAIKDAHNDIYMGTIDNISVKDLPDIFDYIALGHIHTAQAIKGVQHIRYAGSLFPLSFGEAARGQKPKSITIVDFEHRNIHSINELRLPLPRCLVAIHGHFEEVLAIINDFSADDNANIGEHTSLKGWIKIECTVKAYTTDIENEIRQACSRKELELIQLQIRKEGHDFLELEIQTDLKEIDVKDIFLEKCKSAKLSEVETQQALETFQELLVWEKTNAQ